MKDDVVLDNNGILNFSNADIKLLFEFKDGSVEYIPELQSFSVNMEKEGLFYCDLVFIIFDQSSLSKFHNIENIILYAANESGMIASSCLKNISFICYTTSSNIDDIIAEEKVRVEFDDFIPWTKWDISGKCQCTEFAMERKSKWMG
jgi:hypothetical protein